MNREELVKQTRTFLGQFIQNTDISEDHDLFESGLVNSLLAMQLVLFVEKEFGFKVENKDLDIENFKSLDAIVNFIIRKTNGG